MLTDSSWTATRMRLLQSFLIVACASGILADAAEPSLAHTTRDGKRAEASAAGTTSVNETLQASLISHKGSTSLYERGHSYGTLSGPITVQISIAGDTEATISFTCNTSTGTISGRGITSYASAGPAARFNGSLRITHGTGRYAHASTTGLRIQGTLKRHSYALSARVTGTLNV
jgi:hypothetical protein